MSRFLLSAVLAGCASGGVDVSIHAADGVVVPEGAALHARAEAWRTRPESGTPQPGAVLHDEDAGCLATGGCGFTVRGASVEGAQAWLVYAWIDVDGDDPEPEDPDDALPWPDFFPEPHDPQGTTTALVHGGAIVSATVVVEAPPE